MLFPQLILLAVVFVVFPFWLNVFRCSSKLVDYFLKLFNVVLSVLCVFYGFSSGDGGKRQIGMFVEDESIPRDG